jgi:hypothetical protein
MELYFKRIQQNLVKGCYKENNFFAKLVYNALKAYHQLEVWLQTMTAIDEGGRGGNALLMHLETSFQAFCNLQLTSTPSLAMFQACKFSWLLPLPIVVFVALFSSLRSIMVFRHPWLIDCRKWDAYAGVHVLLAIFRAGIMNI